MLLSMNMPVSFISQPYQEPLHPVGDVAELFAGVGGFRIGLARANWRTVFSNQWEPSTKRQHASEVYEARFGSEGHSNEDIARVESLPVPIDLLVGGFPCQDYSVAKSLNSAAGLVGKKGVLWWEIHRLVATHLPQFVFLENVDRLLKSPASQRGRDFAIMLKTLGELGYCVEWRATSASDYGAAQRRIRVFIVAYRGLRPSSPEKARDVILETGVLARALPVQPLQNEIAQVDLSADVTQISDSFNLGSRPSPFENSGFFSNDVAYSIKTEADYDGPRLTLGDVLVADSDVPDEFWIDEKRLPEWEYLKGAKSIPRIHKGTGAIYNYSEGKMSFPDSLDKPSRTVLTGEGGATPSRFKHVVRTATGFRRLLPLELERLNGFPDGWTAHSVSGEAISDARRAFFMGNALVVEMVEKVGHVLAEELLNLREG